MNTPKPQATAIAYPSQSARPGITNLLQSSTAVLSRTGVWAVDTAQRFGSVLAALMGPAVFSAYAIAAWSLAANLGWTDSFVFTHGPLSNWLIWTAIAVAVHGASAILRRATRVS